jgi:hypothetical protein
MKFTKFVELKPGRYYDDKFLLVGFHACTTEISKESLCGISTWKVMKGKDLCYGENAFEAKKGWELYVPEIWCAIEVEL